MKNKYTKCIVVLAVFALLSFAFLPVFVHAQATSSTTYKPLEQIPGTSSGSGDWVSYVKAIYNFGIWAVGIAALFMIMLGGIMYIGSAGNNATMGKAKSIISDAIIGLIMALCAYLILYTINPDLLKVNVPKDTSLATSGTSTGTTGTSSAPSAAQTAKNQQDCNTYCAAGGSDVNTSAADCNSQCMAAKSAQQATSTASNSNPVSGGNCSQINDAINSNNQGVPPATLKAVMGGGEGCNKSLSSDGYGSCGYSQALPATRTACGITGTAAETCAKIQADPNLDVNCAAQTINNMQKYSKGACDPNDPVSAGCCYNGGQGNSDCHKNPGYATKVTNYISKYGST